ncbi:MAG: SGNH/GDSL hydrolase family protein [Planctomycetota bacterium]|nr:MAG: SGNH/GDSL hydrolase family protein [Planctomycetota bacterium]
MPRLAVDNPVFSYWAPLPPHADPLGYRLQRFPVAHQDCIRGQIGPLANVRSASGCAIVFTCDSPHMVLHLERLRHHQPISAHLSLQWRVADGPWHTVPSTDLRLHEGRHDVWLPTGIPADTMAECWVWMPLISTCLLAGISFPGVAQVAAVTLPEPRWLALGDSLTQGFSVPCPHDHWLHRVSQERSLPAWNLGVGGLRIEPELFTWALAERTWDLVTIALGSNHAWREGDAQVAVVEERARRLLDAAVAGDHSRVVWILPPWKPCEEGLGPPEFYGVPLDRAAGARAQRIRDHLRQVLAEYMPAVEVVEDLMPHDHRLLADGLHPGTLGMQAQAQRFQDAVWPSTPAASVPQ